MIEQTQYDFISSSSEFLFLNFSSTEWIVKFQLVFASLIYIFFIFLHLIILTNSTLGKKELFSLKNDYTIEMDWGYLLFSFKNVLLSPLVIHIGSYWLIFRKVWKVLRVFFLPNTYSLKCRLILYVKLWSSPVDYKQYFCLFVSFT